MSHLRLIAVSCLLLVSTLVGADVLAPYGGTVEVRFGSPLGVAQVSHDLAIAYQAKDGIPVDEKRLRSVFKTNEFKDAVAIADGRVAMYEKCRSQNMEITGIESCPDLAAADKKYFLLVTKQLIGKIAAASLTK